jgi:hypothetical protein
MTATAVSESAMAHPTVTEPTMVEAATVVEVMVEVMVKVMIMPVISKEEEGAAKWIGIGVWIIGIWAIGVRIGAARIVVGVAIVGLRLRGLCRA